MTKRLARIGASPDLPPISVADLRCPASRRCVPTAIRRLTDWTTRYFRCSIALNGCGREWWIDDAGTAVLLTDAQVDFVERV